MADAYTGTSSVDFSQAAWDRFIYFDYRPELLFDQVADVVPMNQSMPGSSVNIPILHDLAPATTPLTEAVDVTAVALTDSYVTFTLAEYGNSVLTTAKLRGTSFVDLDPGVANVVGFNAGVSLDSVARAPLAAGTNVAFGTGGTGSGTTRGGVVATQLIRAHDVRVARAYLARNNVPRIGGMYVSYITPDVELDLREETGQGSWRQPHEYSQPGEIWEGELGAFEGFRFIETPRAPIFPDTGSTGTTDVYGTLFMGRQALGKAFSYIDGNGAFPKVVDGPITDKLRRFVPMGWYWLGGFAVFRQTALYRLESSSSIAANTASGTDEPAIDL